MKNLLVTGNSTMPKFVGIFNLPALLGCTPSKWCREHCYALRNRFQWKSIQKVLRWRYLQSLKPDFVSRMVDEISRRKSIRYVRVHISGDFYSSIYVRKWAEIAKACPGIHFRTNTKRQDFLDLMIKEFPSNFMIRESTDATRKGTGKVPQAAIRSLKEFDNFFVCINDCEKCTFYCWYRNVNVVLKPL